MQNTSVTQNACEKRRVKKKNKVKEEKEGDKQRKRKVKGWKERRKEERKQGEKGKRKKEVMIKREKLCMSFCVCINNSRKKSEEPEKLK